MSERLLTVNLHVCVTQGDKGEMGDQGPQGPVVRVSLSINCVRSSIKDSRYIYFIHFLSQGHPGEKGGTGSSDIIDFNGKLLDAFQVGDVKASES